MDSVKRLNGWSNTCLSSENLYQTPHYSRTTVPSSRSFAWQHKCNRGDTLITCLVPIYCGSCFDICMYVLVRLISMSTLCEVHFSIAVVMGC